MILLAWDANWPLSTTKLREYPAGQRANNTAIQNALAAGHTFPGTYGGTAGLHPNLLEFFDSIIFYDTGSDGQWRLYSDDDHMYIDGVQSGSWAQLARFGRATALPEIEFLLCTSWAYLPAGTVMIFGQATLPVNWSEPGSKKNDKLLRVVGGVGAGVGGSWTPSGLTVQNAGLTQHTHTFTATTSSVGQNLRDPNSNNTNIAATHTHAIDDSLDAGGGDHSHNITWHADDAWRPAYYNVIEGVKD